MAAEPANARLHRALRPFQRRLRLRLAGRYLPTTAAIALGAAAIGTWFSMDAATTLLAAAMSAVAVACALAFVRTPTLAATARTVDSELHLQDRTVSALQFSAVDDAIARLVVNEGISRLQAQKPAALRLTVPARGRWLCLGGAVLFVVVFVARDRSSPAPASPAQGSAAVTTSRESSPRGTTATAAAAPASPGEGRETPSASEAGNAVPQTGRGEAPRTAERAGSSERRDGSTQVPDDATGSPASPSATADAARPSPAGAGAGQAGGQGGSGTASASNPSGPGRGAGAAGGREQAAGGVAQGELTTSPQPMPTAPASFADRRDASYPAAYARAESATAADHVPVRLRSYVRAYFLAIRPGSQP